MFTKNIQQLAEAFYIDPNIITELSKGREAAFTQLYTTYSPIIYATILRYVKDEAQADDLLQNIFINIWEKRAGLPAIRHLDNYFFIITRNAVFNYLKKAALDKELFISIAQHQPVGTFATQLAVDNREYEKVLAEAIASLPDQQRQVYLMAVEEELSYQEIADRMSLSKLTVKKHLELSRKFVRGYLNQRFHPYIILPVLSFYFL